MLSSRNLLLFKMGNIFVFLRSINHAMFSVSNIYK